MTQRLPLVVAIATVLAAAAFYHGAGRLSGSGIGFGRSTGCELTEGTAEGDVVPVRAECTWPVPAGHLETLLGDWDEHERIFRNMTESTVLSVRDDVVVVRQVHEASGMTPREVIVEWRVEEIPGGHRYHWRKAADQSALTGTRVEVAVTSGFWEVVPDGDRTRVRYEARYLPGGDLPLSLFHMFQAAGMRAVLANVREVALQTVVAQRTDE